MTLLSVYVSGKPISTDKEVAILVMVLIACETIQLPVMVGKSANLALCLL